MRLLSLGLLWGSLLFGDNITVYGIGMASGSGGIFNVSTAAVLDGFRGDPSTLTSVTLDWTTTLSGLDHYVPWYGGGGTDALPYTAIFNEPYSTSITAPNGDKIIRASTIQTTNTVPRITDPCHQCGLTFATVLQGHEVYTGDLRAFIGPWAHFDLIAYMPSITLVDGPVLVTGAFLSSQARWNLTVTYDPVPIETPEPKLLWFIAALATLKVLYIGTRKYTAIRS